MTPLLCPGWWRPTASSLSSTTTRARGCVRSNSAATASPTMPAPTMIVSTARSLVTAYPLGTAPRGGNEHPDDARLAVVGVAPGVRLAAGQRHGVERAQ